MLVFWDQRLVFLATPKTGSTAIAMSLESLASVSIQRPPVLKHTSVQRFHRFVGPYLKVASGHDFTTVALMREPLDWLGSWFRYRQREDLLDENASTKGMSFDDFASAYCETPQPMFAEVGSQARFLAPEGRAPVDRIFCYERIEDFVEFLEDRLRCEIHLPRVNVSPLADLKLRPETERRVRKAMARDIALYESLS
ncbi:MAG: hypothetical protein Q8K20_15020 [Gemmobacter sp.]|nr:hypothetical protein [Gemmobacter sp.]